MPKRLRSWIGLFIAGLGVMFSYGGVAHAELQSNNYRFEESTIGAGGLVQSSSANYQSTNALGDVAIGSAASANYQVQAGSKTSPDPTLSLAINTTAADFGTFSASSAAVTTATFSVSNYTSYGYVVHTTGSSPRSGSYTIPALTEQTASTIGSKQYGINLVANTSPTSVGSNPDHGDFGVGSPTANYGTPNVYRFVSGDAIASAPSSSGVTTYTITYLVNVDNLTASGQYTTNQTIVVTGTY